MVETSFNEKNMILKIHNNTQNLKVICDTELMIIVMNNLLSNAIKYGYNNGKIILTIDSNKDILSISVYNEGPGFPENQKINLFKKFSRINTPQLMDKPGHDVGLYVTWEIIQLHYGHIWANSEEGKWAEFTFEIPLRSDQCIIKPSLQLNNKTNSIINNKP